MRIAVAAGPDGGAVLRPVADDGAPAGPAERVPDLAAAVAAREAAARADGAEPVRWVWASTARLYPALLAAGTRAARCHDLELVETLLLGHAGRYGEPRSVRAAHARLRGLPVPADPVPHGADPQASLFDTGDPDPGDDLDQIVAVHAAQRRAMAPLPGFALLAAAESAGALAAAELGFDGLPWSAAAHDELLTGLLGPRPAPGLRPRKLQDLADRVNEAFGVRGLNPDSPAQIVKAFAAAGHPVASTRAHVLKRLDHPAVPLLLEYKELARLHTAHGWAWLDTWVRGGRFRAEYVAGGVVSGRWATNGGGALQIPRVLRRAVVADDGWTLVVADAAQLEPRVLAALAGDRAFADAAAHGDLYAALAPAFPDTGGDLTPRGKAKLALLSAMYGGGTGDAAQLLGVLKGRFPAAFGYVEDAARTGERGGLVRSLLGRTCPPPSAGWRELTATGEDERSATALRGRGRFTRNFVVQATAADWALALLAVLRGRLAELGPPRLVFFQHDEVIVHAPDALAGAVVEAVRASAADAARLLFGPTPVAFPMEIAAVRCYADAK
ncbi:bifunctional 3'-5' exonuclease/DNA polymerase [Actinomadura parmotrematis]|uniref:DNA-directed DNA polymerase n=1 Tax=Actinomadura parmotrematis TaxID=2864039 RepID=A0ABS7FQ40_9ACTN|nr:bifunctional 3'-5' exonuclease/DNA polymerase [Actinomadura parmotrematis]MBW8482476.1 bifunctional 3'-5' exonuclease/DNA polymerase [Actinomadura parmotrematis]